MGVGSKLSLLALTIGGVLTVFKKFNNEAAEKKKRLEEASLAMAKAADASRSEYEEVSRLTREYEQLGKIVNPTTDEKKRLTEIQDLLNSKYLTEAERLDLVNGKYEDNIALLREASAERLKEAEFFNKQRLEIAQMAVNTMERRANDNKDGWLSRFFGSFKRHGINGTIDEQINQIITIMDSDIDKSSKEYTRLNERLNELIKAREELIDASHNMAEVERMKNGETEARIEITEKATASINRHAEVAGTVSERLKYFGNETAKNNNALKEAQRSLQGYEKELRSLDFQIRSGNGTETAIARQQELNGKLETAKARVQSLTNEQKYLELQLNATNKEYREFIRESIYSADALRRFERETKLLSSAFDEMNEHKSISIDTMLALMDAGYAAIIQRDKETGAVRINAEAYRDLAKAKLEAQQADYTAQMSELRRERYMVQNSIGRHNADTSVARLHEIDNQIRALELQSHAVAQIAESIDDVVKGNYGRGSSFYQKELDRIENERIDFEKQAEKDRKALEKQMEKDRQSAERQAEKDRKAAEKQAEKDRKALEKLLAPDKFGNNIISITSYIPTIWDDVDTVNRKLEQGLGVSVVGQSTSGKLVSGLETIADNAGSISVPTARSDITSAATLCDVVSAINELRDSPHPRQPLEVNLLIGDGMIGRAVINDINEITERNGESPLLR